MATKVESEEIQRYLRLAESAKIGMRTNPRRKADYDGWMRLVRRARRRVAAVGGAGGWVKVRRGGVKRLPNAIWQRNLGGGLRAVIENLIPLSHELAAYSKVKVWIMRGQVAQPESTTSSLTRGPYWSVEEAKNVVDTHYPRHRAGGKRRSRGSRKVAVTGFYVTSFCNFAHSLKTGRPLAHECYILPPRGLIAERDGRIDEAIKLFAKKKGPIVRGRASYGFASPKSAPVTSSRLGALVSDINRLTR